MWNGSSKIHCFIDFWHSFCWRLWRPCMLLLTKSKGHMSNCHYSKALSSTASSCTDLEDTRFWIGAKNTWDARFCTFLHVFARFYTFFDKWVLEMHVFCTFLHVFASFCMFLHVFCAFFHVFLFMNTWDTQDTYYIALTFQCTIFWRFYTPLNRTDLK